MENVNIVEVQNKENRMTTLNEAIERFENNAEFERRNGNLQGYIAFRQLAEWLKDYKRLLEQEPTKEEHIDVFEVVNSPWMFLDNCANSGYYCLKCKKKLVKDGWSETVKKINYCPNCGARMVEPQAESEEE